VTTWRVKLNGSGYLSPTITPTCVIIFVGLLADRYQVVAVSDGREALLSARESVPALILSDVMIPNLDGFGLLQAVRADAALASVPVVLLSARAGEEAVLEGIRAGADEYLIKPFSARELIARVDAQIQRKQFER
jgi:DNA-binding response OmpR family regulator